MQSKHMRIIVAVVLFVWSSIYLTSAPSDATLMAQFQQPDIRQIAAMYLADAANVTDANIAPA